MASAKIMVERSARITSPKGRASYPTLFAPRAFNDEGDPKYSVTVMVPKGADGDAYVRKITEHQDEAIKKLVAGKKVGNLERWGVNDGDESDDKNANGYWLVKSSSKVRPALIDTNKEPIVDKDTIYGGCDIRVSLCAKAYGTAAKCGVSLELVAVQKVGDNEPFGGAERARADAVNEFDDTPF